MAKRRRRARTSHPGVKIVRRGQRRNASAVWLGRWTDPDTDKLRELSLDNEGYTSDRTRREWAIRKSKELAKRRKELDEGAPRFTGKTLREAVDLYFETKAKRLRPRTAADYRKDVDVFLGWADGQGIVLADELLRQHLAAFREWLASRPRLRPRKGKEVGELRSPATVNKILRSVKAVLNHLEELGQVPKLTERGIKRGLKELARDQDKPDPLRQVQIRQLLEAALRHDRDVFSLTRDEHAKRLKPGTGTTPRYEPMAPFVACVMLTGCRASEALNLAWSTVDFNALDEAGHAAGAIRLRSGATKTRKGRVIDLAVSPGLRRLLSVLKLQAGGNPFVFGGETAWAYSRVEAARKRLMRSHGSGEFSWQRLRQTCGSYLTNAPGIFGAAAVWRSAKQLGHSVPIAEKHYLDVLRGLPREARTLDEVMGIGDLLEQVIEQASGLSLRRRKAV